MKQVLTWLKRLVGHKGIYVAGGAVRDLILGRELLDIDLVTHHDPAALSDEFSRLCNGTLVVLDEHHKIYRVVTPDGFYFDFSLFRNGATTIFEDLVRRDFTINAMALELKHFITETIEWTIDPLGGKRDIKEKLVRACTQTTFVEDPLRILRAFRFSLELEFTIHENTLDALIRCQEQGGLDRVATERIDYELSRIFDHPASWKALRHMAEVNTLTAIVPELKQAMEVDQPGFHHLDVFWHLIETLKGLEEIILWPDRFFDDTAPIRSYLEGNPRRILALKWAALLHDIGKPLVKGYKGERVTFYNHDREGSSITRGIARRLKWPKWREGLVLKLVSNHMRPFHLLNDLRRGGPSARAMRKLLNDLGEDYIGLFVLSMADSLAGAGPLKPKDLEGEISALFHKLHRFSSETLEPIKKGRRLLTGTDVMRILDIPQGPLVGQALEALEEAQCEGLINDASSAERFLKEWLTSCSH